MTTKNTIKRSITENKFDASSIINDLLRKIELPQEVHFYADEEETFMRLWDVQTFGLRSPYANEQACKMWMERETKRMNVEKDAIEFISLG